MYIHILKFTGMIREGYSLSEKDEKHIGGVKRSRRGLGTGVRESSVCGFQGGERTSMERVKCVWSTGRKILPIIN